MRFKEILAKMAELSQTQPGLFTIYQQFYQQALEQADLNFFIDNSFVENLLEKLYKIMGSNLIIKELCRSFRLRTPRITF